jgi:hypothetical protein
MRRLAGVFLILSPLTSPDPPRSRARPTAPSQYPLTQVLPNGEAMDGSKHNYTLTFAKGELPPVNAFWSVTMYDGKSQFLIKNPINRYLINSPMLT